MGVNYQGAKPCGFSGPNRFAGLGSLGVQGGHTCHRVLQPVRPQWDAHDRLGSAALEPKNHNISVPGW